MSPYEPNKPPFLTLPKLIAPHQIEARVKQNRGASMYAINANSRNNAIKLAGSLQSIPSRDSINDDATLQRDRTDMIKRGGL